MEGNDIWEALFGILKGDVPDAMTEDVCGQLARAMTNTPDATPADEVERPQVYTDAEGGLVREFVEFAACLKDNPPMQKRQISVRMIRAVAAAIEAIQRPDDMAKIVAWLRGEATRIQGDGRPWNQVWADAIERRNFDQALARHGDTPT